MRLGTFISIIIIISIMFCVNSCWLSVEEGTIFGFVAPMLAILLVRLLLLSY